MPTLRLIKPVNGQKKADTEERSEHSRASAIVNTCLAKNVVKMSYKVCTELYGAAL